MMGTRNVGLATLFVVLMGACGQRDSGTSGDEVVLFAVDMGDVEWFDPQTESVGVRGDVAPLSWGKTLPAADPDGDLVYEVAVPFSDSLDAPVVFKYKVDGTDNPNDGWQDGANRSLDLSGPRRFAAAFGDPPADRAVTFSGDLRVHESVVAEGLNLAPRDVFVYLPPGYDDGEQRYPVLYMHDGRNVFDASEVGAEWRMDEHAEALIPAGEVVPMIIVGIGNTPDRTQEYTPGASGDNYARLIVEHIKPMIDAEYRTLQAARHTALGGSSLGGLISLHLGLRHPETFGTLLVVSPSIWWDDRSVLKQVEALAQPTGQRIWLDMGGREGGRSVPNARRLNALLQREGWSSADLRYTEVPEADHSERSWAARADEMLRFAFADLR